MRKWWYKYQLWLLRKPSGKIGAFFGVVVGWICFGGVLVLALPFTATLLNNFEESSHTLAFVIALALCWVFVALMGWAAYRVSKKGGYIDAVHRQYLEDLEARRNRLLEKINVQRK